MDKSFSISFQSNAVDSLKISFEMLAKVELDPMYWKWFVISFHNAIQSFLVCVLEDGNGLVCMKREQRVKWLNKYYESRDQPFDKIDLPELELNSLFFLYLNVAQPTIPQVDHNKPHHPLSILERYTWFCSRSNKDPLEPKFEYYETEDNQRTFAKTNIGKLHRLRNDFIHYQVRYYEVYAADIIKPSLVVIEALSFIINELDFLFSWKEDSQKEESVNLVNNIRKLLQDFDKKLEEKA